MMGAAPGNGGYTAAAPDTAWDGELDFGTFSFDVASRTVTWTGEIFRIYGFEPSEVVPSLELLSAHQHPEDLNRWLTRFQRLLTVGGPFCWHYRIIDAQRVERSVIASGEAVTDATGTVTEVRGVFVDLTETLRQHQAAEVTRAVQHSAASRATIDQAKGVLMACFDLTDQQAFDLLRLHSSYANVKLREIAATLVERLTDPELARLPARQRVAAILSTLAEGRGPVLPIPASLTSPAPTSEPADPIHGAAAEKKPALATVGGPQEYPVPTLVHAIDDAGLSITIADCQVEDSPLVYVNAAFVELTGYRAEEALGRNCRFLQGADTESAEVSRLRSALRRGQDVRTVLRNYRRDGSPFWNELHLSGVRDDRGTLTHYIGYQVDVSERVERERQLYQLAYYDAGTGLPNQANALLHLTSLMELDAAIDLAYIRLAATPSDDEIARWDQETSPGALLGRGLRAGIGDDAMVAKLDEDAFLVIQQGKADAAAGLPALLGRPFIPSPGHNPLAVLIGKAGYPADGIDANILIALAKENARPVD